MRDVAGGIVPLERPVEAVGHRVIGDRPGQDRRVKDRRGVVHELGTGIRDRVRQPARQALPETQLEPVVPRGPDVVAIAADRRVFGIGLEELGDGDRRIAQRRGPGDDAEIRIGHALQQRRADRELLGGQLVEIGIGDPDVGDLRSDIGRFDRRVRRELALERHVPLLRVARSERAVDGEHPLAEARVRRRPRSARRSGRSEERRRVKCCRARAATPSAGTETSAS